MANRSQGATATAAAAGDNGHDDDDAVVCLDGTTTTEGLSSLYSYVPTQDEIRTALKSTKIVGTMDKKKQELAAAGLPAEFVPSKATAKTLAAELPAPEAEGVAASVLYPASALAADTLWGRDPVLHLHVFCMSALALA